MNELTEVCVESVAACQCVCRVVGSTCRMMWVKASGCPPPWDVRRSATAACRIRNGSVKQNRRSHGLRACLAYQGNQGNQGHC